MRAVAFIDGLNFYHSLKAAINTNEEIDVSLLWCDIKALIAKKLPEDNLDEIRYYNSDPKHIDDKNKSWRYARYCRALEETGVVVIEGYFKKINTKKANYRLLSRVVKTLNQNPTDSELLISMLNKSKEPSLDADNVIAMAKGLESQRTYTKLLNDRFNIARENQTDANLSIDMLDYAIGGSRTEKRNEISLPLEMPASLKNEEYEKFILLSNDSDHTPTARRVLGLGKHVTILIPPEWPPNREFSKLAKRRWQLHNRARGCKLRAQEYEDMRDGKFVDRLQIEAIEIDDVKNATLEVNCETPYKPTDQQAQLFEHSTRKEDSAEI